VNDQRFAAILAKATSPYLNWSGVSLACACWKTFEIKAAAEFAAAQKRNLGWRWIRLKHSFSLLRCSRWHPWL